MMDPGQSKAFLRTYPEINYPLYSRGKHVFAQGEIRAVPTTYLVDRDGSIVATDLMQARKILTAKQAKRPRDGGEVEQTEEAAEAAPASLSQRGRGGSKAPTAAPRR